MMGQKLPTVLSRQATNNLHLLRDRFRHWGRFLNAGIQLVEHTQDHLSHLRVASDLRRSVGLHPTGTEGEQLDVFGGQLGGEFGDDHVRAGLCYRVADLRGDSGDAGESDVAAWAGDEDDLLLLALAGEREEGVDQVDLREKVESHLESNVSLFWS